MSRIKGRNTGPERTMAELFCQAGLECETHVSDLPGRPDFVFRETRVAVFVDGDFWHGWRFPAWRMKLSEAWDIKIAANRRRDARNHAKLRRAGWSVIRLWEHQIEGSASSCLERVLVAIAIPKKELRPPGKAVRPTIVLCRNH